MTKADFSEYAKALRNYYPKEKLLQTQDSMRMWYEQIKDIPYEKALADLDEWVKVSKWSPTIADILGEHKAGVLSVGMSDYIKLLEGDT